MPKCVVCGADTKLFVNTQPICVKCDDQLARQEKQAELKSLEYDLDRSRAHLRKENELLHSDSKTRR